MLVALIDQLDRVHLGEFGIGDDHLVDRVRAQYLLQVAQRPKRSKPVGGKRVGREEPDDLDRRMGVVAERVSDVANVLAGPYEHRAAAVAGGAQQRAGRPLVGRAQHRHVQQGEGQGAVEEVVAGEVFAVDDREQQRHEGDLEEGSDDARQAGPLSALGVQARAREQQRGEQVCEREDAFGFVQRGAQLHVVAHRRLQQQCGQDCRGSR